MNQQSTKQAVENIEEDMGDEAGLRPVTKQESYRWGETKHCGDYGTAVLRVGFPHLKLYGVHYYQMQSLVIYGMGKSLPEGDQQPGGRQGRAPRKRRKVGTQREEVDIHTGGSKDPSRQETLENPENLKRMQQNRTGPHRVGWRMNCAGGWKQPRAKQ